MVAESCSEELLIQLERDLRQLFLVGGTITLSPRERYDHANTIIAHTELLLETKKQYPELREVFAKLEASLDIAHERRAKFELRNPNLT